MADTAARKQRGQPFRKGESGNPSGRPHGSRNRATLLAQALLDGEAEDVTRKAIELAKAGDPVALRLVLERLVPPRRERPIVFTLQEIKTVTDVPAAVNAVAQAVADGQLSPTEAQGLTSVIEAYRRAVETVDLDERVRRIEERLREEH